MDIKAIIKAQSRLRSAEKALLEIKKCNNHIDFMDSWYVFLVSAKAVYTTLEQGAKQSARLRQWFGGVKNIRRNDPLLRFLFEARNDEEHGLEASAEYVPGKLVIGVQEEGFSRSYNVKGMTGPGGSIDVTSNDGKPVLVHQSYAHTRLTAIKDRGGRIIGVPEMHLGQPLDDRSPINVAKLGLAYLQSLVLEAQA